MDRAGILVRVDVGGHFAQRAAGQLTDDPRLGKRQSDMLATLIFALMLLSPVAYAGEFALGPSGQEQIVAANLLVPDGGWSIAAFDASNCLQVSHSTTNAWANDLACSDIKTQISSAKGVWLTALRVLVTDDLASGSNGSCEFRLTTSSGSSLIPGSVLEVGGGSGAAMSEGTVFEAKFIHRLAAGEAIQIEARNGSNCGAGSSCVCQDLGQQHMSIWGRF